jgi:glutathione S-transferase
MLTIHHLGFSQSERIIWLCEELGLPYRLVRYDRLPSGMAPPEYKALHPLGTAPIITDGDLVLAETCAIVEYIAWRHAGGRLILGPDHPDFVHYLFWYHYANGTVLPAFIMETVGKRAGLPGMSARTDIAFELVEKRLGEAEWFAGSSFTAADILMGFALTRGRAAMSRDISNAPNLLAYLQRVGARPAFQIAMTKAEPNAPPALS